MYLIASTSCLLELTYSALMTTVPPGLARSTALLIKVDAAAWMRSTSMDTVAGTVSATWKKDVSCSSFRARRAWSLRRRRAAAAAEGRRAGQEGIRRTALILLPRARNLLVRACESAPAAAAAYYRCCDEATPRLT